jgi:hypothetical protein
VLISSYATCCTTCWPGSETNRLRNFAYETFCFCALLVNLSTCQTRISTRSDELSCTPGSVCEIRVVTGVKPSLAQGRLEQRWRSTLIGKLLGYPDWGFPWIPRSPCVNAGKPLQIFPIASFKIIFNSSIMGNGITVSIATGWMTGRGKKIFSLHSAQHDSGAHTASYSTGTGGKAAGAWSWPLTSM